MQIFRLTILRCSRTFFEFSLTFSRFRSSILSDLFCSYSEVKLVANINWLQHSKKTVLLAQLELIGVRFREVNGSNPGRGKVFVHP